MKRQPPTADTPKDTTVCGPCVWLHQPKEATEKDAHQLMQILDTYLEVLHKRFTS